MIRRPPRSTLFPYTTLFRSRIAPNLITQILVDLQDDSQVPAGIGVGGEKGDPLDCARIQVDQDRKSTRLNSSHQIISYAVFCFKKKKKNRSTTAIPSFCSR